jgi:hypothetical protein
VGNNPASVADPSGRCFVILCVAAIVAAPIIVDFAFGVAGYVVANGAVNLLLLDKPVFDGLNGPDALISGAAGIVAGPAGGLATIPRKLAAGAAIGCAQTVASEVTGSRDPVSVETGVGCAFGALGPFLPGEGFKAFMAGTVASVAQAYVTLFGQQALSQSEAQK